MHFASAVGWTPLGAYTQGKDFNCTSTMCYGMSGRGATFEAFQTALKNKAKALGFNGKLPSGATSFASDGKIGKDTVYLTGWVAKTLVNQGFSGAAMKEIALAVQLDLLTKEQVAALVGDLLSELTPATAVEPVSTMMPAAEIFTTKPVKTLPYTPIKPLIDRTIYTPASLPPTSTMEPIAAGPSNAVLIGASILGGLALIGGIIAIARGVRQPAMAGVGDVDGVGVMRDYRDAVTSPHSWSNKDLEVLAQRMEIQAATRDSGEYQERAAELRRLVALRKT